MAHATETDQYFAIDKPPRDSLDVLNEKVNRDILGALELVNRGDWEHTSCEDVSHRIYQRFRIAGLHKIELWAENTPRIDRTPHKKEYSEYIKKSSIYRNTRLWDWGLTFGVKATFNIAGVHMGADKLSHFFQTGWKYIEHFRAYVREGLPEREALERMIRYGVGTEYGPLGLAATGVFSFGDLEANYQGFRFYRSLCQEKNPRILKTAEGWRLLRLFDWREYVSPRFDESYNNSAFTPKRWSEVRANLRRDYCPRLDTEAFREHYWRCSHFTREPDDFNARFVRELIARGDAPRQDAYSIWAACERSGPEVAGVGGAALESGPWVSPEPAPRYETPRFDDAILRSRFELGVGGFNSAGSTWNVLLRTRFVLRETVVPEDAWDAVRTPEYLLWGALEGTLAVNPGPLGGQAAPGKVFNRTALPFANIHVTPVERRFELNNAATGDTLAVGVALAPVRLTRDTRLDRSLGVEVSAASARARQGMSLGERQHVRLFAAVVLEGPGYKAALHLSDVGAFHGVHLATLAAEGGAELLLGEQLRLGLILGGRAELSLGWSRGGGGFSAPSDLEAYAEAQVDVTRFLRLFARGQLDALHEPAPNRFLSAPAFLAGASFRF
ncbi:hypothetical protein [Vitiosangium sp. GDMCC 1.1324]|uniref:hypothetical protein n=1 Tax=Vitiosangium sp. (strain GDMCC 1.1324) TaxID=2138576 RepID=UPI000D3746B6|nr:hypothetical protein [Vitiosangium sp. GDMCC 1.1324]PTL83644.1 hypothetical protein DAT35_09165 [Vitiosangium sp. GDMCC 1.1324]